MDSPTTEATSSSSPSFLTKIAAACVTFLVGLKHDAVKALVGILPTLEHEGDSFVAAEVAKLLHAIAALPMGSTIEVLAEGYAVKVIGNGLPRHGAAADLLGAIEDALGLPSHISTAPPTPVPEPAVETPATPQAEAPQAEAPQAALETTAPATVPETVAVDAVPTETAPAPVVE